MPPQDAPAPLVRHTVEADGLATVTLVARTMTDAFFEAVRATFDAVAAESGVRAVVVTSEGDHFSYGLDLKEAMATLPPLLSAADRAPLHALIRRWQAAFDTIAACPAPTIGAITGWCIGGGLDLASALDVRVASADAVFSLREAELGIVADLGSLQRLPGIIGEPWTRQLAFTAQDIAADSALRMGLVTEVFADRAAAVAGAYALARATAAHPTATTRGIKHVLDRGRTQSVEEGLAYVAEFNTAHLSLRDVQGAVMGSMQRRAAARRAGAAGAG